MHTPVLAAVACFGLVVAFLAVHSYFVEEDIDSDSDLADGLVAAAIEVYTAAEGLVAEVALAGSEQPMHSEAVLDAVLLGATNSAYYCPVQLALDNP